MNATMQATYSVEDNKLRLYAEERLDAETFQKVKAAGFRWAPKQQLFVAPKWTPSREDLCIELAGEIEPEGTTLAERAELKAQRLDTIAANKARAANAYSQRASDISQRFDMGQPILIGHHSERKARKDAERMDTAQRKANENFKAISYWQYRAEGVERHANYKNRSDVRARRIKTLLKELRDVQRTINNAHLALDLLNKLSTDEQITVATGRTDLFSMGTYYAVQKGEVTPADAKAAAIARYTRTIEGPTLKRWIAHILGRLGYERSMLGEVTRYSGDVTPVILQAFAREHGAHKPKAERLDESGFTLTSPAPLPLHIGDGDTLTLTDSDWCDLMQSIGYEVPAPKPRAAPRRSSTVPIINPTKEQAEQLQRIWNMRMQKECAKNRHNATPSEIYELTQAVYSANSKGDYAPCKTVEIAENGEIVQMKWHKMERVKSGVPVARVRVRNASDFYQPRRVLVITDKPQKALPIDLDQIEKAEAAELEACA
jgi:hypothetical protein